MLNRKRVVQKSEELHFTEMDQKYKGFSVLHISAASQKYMELVSGNTPKLRLVQVQNWDNLLVQRFSSGSNEWKKSKNSKNYFSIKGYRGLNFT